MKTSVSFFLIFLSLFLLTPLAISGTFADQSPDHRAFSFDGSTTSRSSGHGGHGTTHYRVSGSANISGTAIELGQDSVYKGKLWLMVTGDLDSSPFPGKGNIDTSKHDGVAETFTKDDAKILYLSHPVGSIAPGEVSVYDSQVARELTGSLSASYLKGSYSSPTGLCASPEFFGSLSGTLMNHSGSQSLSSLSFKSETNKACADSLDDGSATVAVEHCGRKQNCDKRFTAKPVSGHSQGSHYVECEEYLWEREGIVIAGKRFLEKKKPCPVYWWTCDDDPDDPTTVNKCLRTHVSSSELHLEERYVDADGNPVDPTEKGPCGHLLSASGDHTLQASCSTDSKCISTNFYQCLHSQHEYQKLLACGHKEGSAGVHRKTYHRWCGHTDWYCLGAAGHNYVKCPRKADGDFCRTDPKYPGYRLPCDTSHVHTYLSDQPPEPKQVTPTTTDPKPKQITPTTTDPKPKQVLPKDDDADDDGGTTRVDPQVTSPCGHTHKKSAASSHREVSFNCGKHSYYACTPPSSSETNRHITQTLACGNHVGRACTASLPHLSAMSCPTQNGKSCSYGSYYQCSRHTHAYPETKQPAPRQALQYHPCGHLLSASGNHSKVTSCSVTNSGGDTCTNGRDYYACTPHVHSFPSVPESPSKPDPSVDPYVTCGAGHTHKTSESSSHASVSHSCGFHSYYACQPPSSSEKSRHEVGLLPCGQHTHRRCRAARSHTQAMVCPGKDGKACTIGSYYRCTRPIHKHVYPATQDPQEVKKYACGHDTTHRRGSSYHAWVSSCNTAYGSDRCTVSGGYYFCTPHTHNFVATCSAGHKYNPESDAAYTRHAESKTCPTKNGQSCTIGSYYACSPHTHKYPSKPPPKSTVKCGNSWSGSGACTSGRVVSSSSTEHKSSACSSGHTYWTCNSTVNVSSWESKHRTRTCRRSGCSNSWQACVDGWTAPRCNAKSGSGCWAR